MIHSEETQLAFLELVNERLERELAEAKAEIARLRAIPRPPEPQQTNSEGWQIWHSCVEYYESQMREQD